MIKLKEDFYTLPNLSSDDYARAFLNQLSVPSKRDYSYRADLFRRDNPSFARQLCQFTNIQQFDECINVTYNATDDLNNWKTLVAMPLTLREEMSRWTHIHDPHPSEFHLWNVVRMFQHRLHQPGRESSLLDYCRIHPYKYFSQSLQAR